MIPITAELAALAVTLELANLRTREQAVSRALVAQHEQWHRDWLLEILAAPTPFSVVYRDDEKLGNSLWYYWLDTYGQPL